MLRLLVMGIVFFVGSLLDCGIRTASPHASQPQSYSTVPAAFAPRFEAFDLFVDAGPTPLAAYQVSIRVTRGDATLVGIEGGEQEPFAAPPYYDPAALGQGRVIVAALSTEADLPAGRQRVARLHMQVNPGDRPVFETTVIAAGNRDGDRIDAIASVIPSKPIEEGSNP